MVTAVRRQLTLYSHYNWQLGIEFPMNNCLIFEYSCLIFEYSIFIKFNIQFLNTFEYREKGTERGPKKDRKKLMLLNCGPGL